MQLRFSTTLFKPAPVVLAAAILLQACGGSDGDFADTATMSESSTEVASIEDTALLPDMYSEVERESAADTALYADTTALLFADLPDEGAEAGASQVEKATVVAPTRSDPRVAYWVDPRLTFSSHRKWGPVKQVSGRNTELYTVSEPGVVGRGSDYALSRVKDPLNSSKSAFRHRIASNFPKWGDTWRSEISANWSTDGTNVIRGNEYWMAWAVKFNSDMLQSNSGEASILDFHVVPDAHDSNPHSPFHLFVRNGTMRIQSKSNPSYVTNTRQSVDRKLWEQSNPGADKWHYFVMKARFHWDNGKKPYIRIWKATGNGSLVKIVDHAGPNAYNDKATYLPQKFGLYRWDKWSGPSTRTMYSKGFYVLRATSGTPTLNEQSMLALLKGV